MQREDESAEANEERRRQRVNIAAGVFLVALVALAVWTVKLFNDHEQLQRCIDSRRPNCFEVQQPATDGPRLPAH